MSFTVDALDADVLGDEPIWYDGKVIGWVTSGGYGHYVDRRLRKVTSLQLWPWICGEGAFEIEIIGDRRKASILSEPLFDPAGARMRM